MDDLVTKEVYHLEERERLGNVLITLYEDTRPLGSLLLHPEDHKFIIESIHELPGKWESFRRQEAERRRIKQDGKQSKGDDGYTG